MIQQCGSGVQCGLKVQGFSEVQEVLVDTEQRAKKRAGVQVSDSHRGSRLSLQVNFYFYILPSKSKTSWRPQGLAWAIQAKQFGSDLLFEKLGRKKFEQGMYPENDWLYVVPFKVFRQAV